MALESVDTLRYVPSKQTKKIPEKPRKAFARVLQHLIDSKYEGNQTRAGKALHVTQGHISALLRGDRGPGLNMLLLMRLETGKTIDEMLGFEAAPEQELENRLVASVQVEALRVTKALREARMELESLHKERTPADGTKSDKSSDDAADAVNSEPRVRKQLP